MYHCKRNTVNYKRKFPFLTDQVRALWQKPVDTPNHNVNIQPGAVQDVQIMPEQSSSTPETTSETVIVDIPTANRYSALQETTEPPGKKYSVNPPPSSTPEKVVPDLSCHSTSATVKPNSAVFLCDSNGKFLNKKKLFHPMQDFKNFRCPRTETARTVVQNELFRPSSINRYSHRDK